MTQTYKLANLQTHLQTNARKHKSAKNTNTPTQAHTRAHLHTSTQTLTVKFWLLKHCFHFQTLTKTSIIYNCDLTPYWLWNFNIDNLKLWLDIHIETLKHVKFDWNIELAVYCGFETLTLKSYLRHFDYELRVWKFTTLIWLWLWNFDIGIETLKNFNFDWNMELDFYFCFETLT